MPFDNLSMDELNVSIFDWERRVWRLEQDLDKAKDQLKARKDEWGRRFNARRYQLVPPAAPQEQK